MCRAPDESEAYPEMDAATGVNVHGFSGQTLITYVMAKEQREAVCYTCNACSWAWIIDQSLPYSFNYYIHYFS